MDSHQAVKDLLPVLGKQDLCRNSDKTEKHHGVVQVWVGAAAVLVIAVLEAENKIQKM